MYEDDDFALLGELDDYDDLDVEDLMGQEDDYDDEDADLDYDEEDLLGAKWWKKFGKKVRKYGDIFAPGAGLLARALHKKKQRRRRRRMRRVPSTRGRLLRPRGREFRGQFIRSESPLMPGIPGAPPVSAKEIPLGLGQINFTAALAVAAGTLTARPQVPIRPKRAIFIVTRNAADVGIGVTVTDIQVGTKSQFAGTAAIPAEAFAANAWGVLLKGDSAQPGIDVVANLALTAVPAVSVIVSGTLICDAIS